MLQGGRKDTGVASKFEANGRAGRVFLYNATVQYENLGDLKINKYLFQSLRLHGQIRFNTKNSKAPLPEPGVNTPSAGPSNDNPEYYYSKMGIEPHEILSAGVWGFVKIIIKNSPVNIFLSPAGKMKVYLVFTPGGISGNLTPGVLARAAFIFFASQLGARPIRLGVSLGPFSPKRETIERLQARCLTVNTVRDPQSEDYAKQLGIRNIRRFPDFGFLVKRNAETHNPLPANAPYCVISLRNDNLSPRQTQQMLDWLERCVSTMCAETKPTLVFSWQVTRDAGLMRALAAQYGDRFNVHTVEPRDDDAELFAVYRDAAFLLTNRLHVFLFAASQGSIPLAVVTGSANQKLTGLIRDLELDHLMYDYTEQPDVVPTWQQIDAFSCSTKEQITRAFDRASTSIHQDLETMFQNDA